MWKRRPVTPRTRSTPRTAASPTWKRRWRTAHAEVKGLQRRATESKRAETRARAAQRRAPDRGRRRGTQGGGGEAHVTGDDTATDAGAGLITRAA